MIALRKILVADANTNTSLCCLAPSPTTLSAHYPKSFKGPAEILTPNMFPDSNLISSRGFVLYYFLLQVEVKEGSAQCSVELNSRNRFNVIYITNRGGRQIQNRGTLTCF